MHQRARQLRLGVRLPLPHPEPRRDGHDAAGARWRSRRSRPTAWSGRSQGNAERHHAGTTTRSPRRRSSLQRSTNGITWTTVATVTSPLTVPQHHQLAGSLTDPTSNSNTAYLYRVVARNTVGYGGAYPAVTVRCRSRRRSASDLPVTASVAADTPSRRPCRPDRRCGCVWNDTATNETGFVIERRDGRAGTFAQIAVAPARNGTGSTNFTDTTDRDRDRLSVPGRGRQPRRAQSAYSNIATAAPPRRIPAAPSNLTAANGANQGNKRSVVLTWTDNSSSERDRLHDPAGDERRVHDRCRHHHRRRRHHQPANDHRDRPQQGDHVLLPDPVEQRRRFVRLGQRDPVPHRHQPVAVRPLSPAPVPPPAPGIHLSPPTCHHACKRLDRSDQSNGSR